MLRQETSQVPETMMHQSEEDGSHAVQRRTSPLVTMIMIAALLIGFMMLIGAVIMELMS
jgi:hypothetical protein